IPPFLASPCGNMPMSACSAFSLAPMPEDAGSLGELQHLADIRRVDLLYAGTVSSPDVPDMMERVGEAVRHYAQLWENHVKVSPQAPLQALNDDGAGVNEILYSFMNERDKLTELSKMVGKLRFAIEGDDHRTRSETQEEIDILGRFLPERFDIPSLLLAVSDSSSRGGQLAQLYLDRCYRLSDGDDEGAHDLDEKIETLKALG
ncbi:MAG: hypothetical protein J4G01_05590, partial [Dehalococcoidia bacterium]|nr:hypothetical protein [Dehalococcoidia bacterium]